MPRFRTASLALLCAAAAAPADAARRVYGSTLRASATVSHAFQADTAFWPTLLRGERPGAPADGQILAIRLKGTVVASEAPGAPPPLNEIHFQHLVRRSNGAMYVDQTTQAFQAPIGGPRNRITTYFPENLCVGRGDVVDFNDEGGWAPPFYQRGVPFRVFSSVRGSWTAHFSRDSGTFNGSTFSGSVRRHEELLLQLVLGTGRDFGAPCRNWLRSH